MCFFHKFVLFYMIFIFFCHIDLSCHFDMFQASRLLLYLVPAGTGLFLSNVCHISFALLLVIVDIVYCVSFIMFFDVCQQPNRQKAQNIMPVTVGQITKAEQIEDKFLVGNIELNQVLVHCILPPPVMYFAFIILCFCGSVGMMTLYSRSF